VHRIYQTRVAALNRMGQSIHACTDLNILEGMPSNAANAAAGAVGLNTGGIFALLVTSHQPQPKQPLHMRLSTLGLFQFTAACHTAKVGDPSVT
jgi:hypothetical protein